MHRKTPLKRTIAAGRRRGAVLGAAAFLAGGAVPGFTLGSTAALILAAHLGGHAPAPGWTNGGLVLAGGMIGAVCAASISILLGWIAGGALAWLARSIRSSLQERREEQERSRTGLRVLPHGPMAEPLKNELQSRLSFLEHCRDSIRSIVVVGSAAHGADADGSDIDIVVVPTAQGAGTVQSVVAEQELDGALRGRGTVLPIDITVLEPSQVRKLLDQASPFGFALCRGHALFDDGYHAGLSARQTRAPGRAYALTALYQTIMVPYYGSFRALQNDARERACSSACCNERGAGCPGIASTELPATALMRMLYVTLPLRGFLPLTKEDVIAFTRQEYGDESAGTLRRAVALARSRDRRVTYEELQRFRRLAGMLYREILTVVGTGRAVSRMLRDGANLMQGRHGQLQDRDLRRCVLATMEIGNR